MLSLPLNDNQSTGLFVDWRCKGTTFFSIMQIFHPSNAIIPCLWKKKPVYGNLSRRHQSVYGPYAIRFRSISDSFTVRFRTVHGSDTGAERGFNEVLTRFSNRPVPCLQYLHCTFVANHTKNHTFFAKYLHIWKKCCTFASAFEKQACFPFLPRGC